MLDFMRENSEKEGLKEISTFLGREKLKDFITIMSKDRIETTSKILFFFFINFLSFFVFLESENTLYRDDDIDTWFIHSIFTLQGERFLKQIFTSLFEKLSLMPEAFEVKKKKKSTFFINLFFENRFPLTKLFTSFL